MLHDIPREYVTLKFFQYGINPSHNKFNDTYQCGCPICREGNSELKRRRCYYLPKTNVVYCHNCGFSGGALRWIREVSNLTDAEIEQELRDYSIDVDEYIANREKSVETREVPTLPQDCINLFDETQVNFHKDNTIVIRALDEIKKRRLDTACNKPKALYVSLNDKTHKNRLVIPFYDETDQIEFYQSRLLVPDDRNVKFYSKTDGHKTLFNFNNIDPDRDTIFIFEGPFDSFFVQNGVSLGGINGKSRESFTPRQKEQLTHIRKFYEIVWVLDSQWIDDTAREKTEVLLGEKEKVFIWPASIGQDNKDFNDVCIKYELDKIDPKFITDNSYSGFTGMLRLKAMS